MKASNAKFPASRSATGARHGALVPLAARRLRPARLVAPNQFREGSPNPPSVLGPREHPHPIRFTSGRLRSRRRAADLRLSLL